MLNLRRSIVRSSELTAIARSLLVLAVAVAVCAAPAGAQTVGIMPMGDSITAGGGYPPGGTFPMDDPTYRYYLYHQLTDSSGPVGWDVDYLGLHSGHRYHAHQTPNDWSDSPGKHTFLVPDAYRYPGSPPQPFQDFPDQDMTGSTGYGIGRHYLAYGASYLRGAMAMDPDMVLVHLGTNDLGGRGGRTLAQIMASPQTTRNELRTLIQIIQAERAETKVYVANIIPLGDGAYGYGPGDLPAGDPGEYALVQEYNFGNSPAFDAYFGTTTPRQSIADVVADINANLPGGAPEVVVVDMWTDYPSRQTGLEHLPDLTHPDYVGDEFMAAQWSGAMVPEPATVTLAAFASLAVLRLRTARRCRPGHSKRGR